MELLCFENGFHEKKITCHLKWYNRYNYPASHSKRVEGIFASRYVFKKDRWERGIIMKSVMHKVKGSKEKMLVCQMLWGYYKENNVTGNSDCVHSVAELNECINARVANVSSLTTVKKARIK